MTKIGFVLCHNQCNLLYKIGICNININLGNWINYVAYRKPNMIRFWGAMLGVEPNWITERPSFHA